MNITYRIDPRHSELWKRPEDVAQQRHIASLARQGQHERIREMNREAMDIFRARIAVMRLTSGRA